MKYVDGTHYLIELIKRLSDDRNANSYRGNFTVTAVVGKNVKVDRDIIDCFLVIQHDSVDICIYWEDCGYKSYKDMGLYGKANSKYQEIKKLNDNSLKIRDKSGAYEIMFEGVLNFV